MVKYEALKLYPYTTAYAFVNNSGSLTSVLFIDPKLCLLMIR